MDFVLASLITLGIVFLVLLGLIVRIIYKRSRNKLKVKYTNKESIFMKINKVIGR